MKTPLSKHQRAVEVELDAAYAAWDRAGIVASNVAALEEFVRHLIAAVQMEEQDARLIEGDDEAEIRGH